MASLSRPLSPRSACSSAPAPSSVRTPRIGHMKASAEELRPLFLFEHLNDEQLAWLSAEGTIRDYAAGELICAEGDFAEFLFVLLDGEISLAKTVQDDVVQLTRSAR